jgi:hypothetical protein
MSRKTAGGAALIIAGGFLGRETLVWAFNKTLDAASSGIQNGIDFAALSWQNSAALALIVIGFSLVVWPKGKTTTGTNTETGSEPKISYARLLNSANSIVHRVRDHRSTNALWRDKLEPPGDIARAGMSVLLSFQKAGFTVPNFSNQQYSENVAIGLEAYFSAILQLIADGHIDEAKQVAIGASSRAEQLASAFNGQSWFHSEW